MEAAEKAKIEAINATNSLRLAQDGGKSSIFSFLSVKSKERLSSFAKKASFIQSVKSKEEEENSKPSGPPLIYTVPTKVAEAALKGFMPFGNDLPKQNRYRLFLQEILEKAKAETADGKQLPIPKMSDEAAHETREFSKAAMIYRPHSNMIASRFANETGKDVTAKEDVNVSDLKLI